MDRLYSMAADAGSAALVLVPMFLVLQRRHRLEPSRTVQYLLFAVYLCGVYAAAGLPCFRCITFRPRVNLTLFAYMFSDYRSSLLNILFFIPMGFLLPMIWTRFRAVYRTVPFGLAASIFIEGTQLLSPRATDVNDLITNTLGTVIGYSLAMMLQWLLPDLKPENDSRDVYPICLLVVVVMFFIHPLLP